MFEPISAAANVLTIKGSLPTPAGRTAVELGVPYPRLHAAILFAAERHAAADLDGDDPLPYLLHPLEVLSALRHIGGVRDEDQLVAAVLHDTIEENAATGPEIAQRFGARAARIVRMLTREEPTGERIRGMDKDAIWLLRAEMLLTEIAAMPAEALPIKLADRLSNVREANRTKQGKKLERYRWQTREILRIVPREINPPLWDAIAAELAVDQT